MAVGGVRKGDFETTNEVFTFDERSRKWKRTIPPMPTASNFPGVLNIQSALLVAGGDNTVNVEIFKPDTSQWYSTDPLPTACQDISFKCIGSTCYAIGGFKYPLRLNQALYASVDDLLHNAVPANQTTHADSFSNVSDTPSIWKALPNTPLYQPAAAVLSGKLLAIGGRKTSKIDATTKTKCYILYSPSTDSWVYFSDLPAPRSNVAVDILSATEILVIGGLYDDDGVNTVYKRTLHVDL